MKKLEILLVLGLLFANSLCYLELEIFRNQLQQTLRNKNIKCITMQVDEEREKRAKQNKKKRDSKKNKDDQQKSSTKQDKQQDQQQSDEEQNQSDQQINDQDIPQNQNYKQICYEKDISYSLPIYIQGAVNLISLDTTIPISWFKGENCRLEASSKKCSRIELNMKQKIVEKLKQKPKKDGHSKTQFAIIQGSSELVKGIEQKTKNFVFTTRDSSRLTNFIELIMLGFYMRGEKDNVALQNTNFINAVQISKNLNYLCDGAISLRFDEMSEKSFINQLINYQKIQERYVTIKIGPFHSIIAFGQVATKYSKNGYGGLEWIDIKQDQNYGKLPVITDIIIENKNSTGHNFCQLKDKQYPAVISLSASYIGIPKQVMAKWLQKFNKKSNCQVNQKTKYLQCKNLKQSEQQKIITFTFSDKKISFSLSELILGKTKGKTLLNMKQTIHDKYAILGEPFFLKYFVVFDYKNNKVGFGQKFQVQEQQFINVISVIRFVCFVFFFGCSFIICYLPIKRCFQVIKSRTKYGIIKNQKGQTRRLRQYAPIQQNPYDQLSSKVKQALQTQDNH